MRVKIVIISKGKAGESCEVYEHQGDELKIEVTEQKEPDTGS